VHDGCEVARRRETLARFRFAVRDCAADLRGDLVVQQGGVVAVDLDLHGCASHISSENARSGSSALMSVTAAPPPVEDLDAGVIEEARARERRHRRIAGTVVVLAVAVGAVVLALSPGGAKPPAARASLTFAATGPTVNARAFGHEGDLAFISRGTLWVLDGSSGRLRKVTIPRGLVPESPTPTGATRVRSAG
jgi:hypothetical protein